MLYNELTSCVFLFRYLFSLSFVTRRGPTSIRILYKNGRFLLDSEKEQMKQTQEKASSRDASLDSCVIGMVLKYTGHLREVTTTSLEGNAPVNNHRYINDKLSTTSDHQGFSCYWFDKGLRQEIMVDLIQPLNKSNVTSLKSLCRLHINKSLRTWEAIDKVSELPLTEAIRSYIKNYPYPV